MSTLVASAPREIARRADELGLDGPDITDAYRDAVSWANDVFAAAR